jgi:hypothetical protein
MQLDEDGGLTLLTRILEDDPTKVVVLLGSGLLLMMNRITNADTREMQKKRLSEYAYMLIQNV